MIDTNHVNNNLADAGKDARHTATALIGHGPTESLETVPNVVGSYYSDMAYHSLMKGSHQIFPLVHPPYWPDDVTSAAPLFKKQTDLRRTARSSISLQRGEE